MISNCHVAQNHNRPFKRLAFFPVSSRVLVRSRAKLIETSFLHENERVHGIPMHFNMNVSLSGSLRLKIPAGP